MLAEILHISTARIHHRVDVLWQIHGGSGFGFFIHCCVVPSDPRVAVQTVVESVHGCYLLLRSFLTFGIRVASS